MDAQGSSQTISKHIVKPSYPTPNHLKTLKLSLLDQLAPPTYMPLIFLYDEPKGLTTTNHAQISQQLKQCLSETLTLFYPIAGKLNRENFTIDCNDTGVEYTEARVRTRLVDVTQNPTMDKLNDLLPMDPKYMLSVLLAVRVSFFSCGGIGIGVCLSHQIADGYSLGLFMNAWANTCRRRKVEPPGLGLLARHFPVKDLSSGYNVTSTLNVAKDQMFVTKSFVFDKENLAALKQAATSSHTSSNIVKDPTRVELVSAFIWKHCMDDEKWKGEKIIGASQLVNMRRKTSTAIHDDLKDIENVFGNYFLNSVAFDSTGAAFDQLVRKLRDAIRRIDDEYIRKAHIGEDYLEDIIESLDLIRKGDQMRMFTFTSLSRFPLYKVDHGWGMPVCVGVTSVHLNNVAVLGSTKYGDGIEVWVTMLQDNIETFETRFKLLGRTKAQSVKSNL